MRLDDPRLARARRARPRGPVGGRVVRRGVGATTACSSPRRCSRTAQVRHVHRKLLLPTYGLFDERRFFAAGRHAARRAVAAGRRRRARGVRGLLAPVDVPQVLALDGAQILINVSSSPGRDLAATNEVGLGTATSWRTLMRTYAQLTTSFVVFCNRVGVDESISFWGGSEVDRRRPARRCSARRCSTRACSTPTSTSPTSAASGSRCRCCATSGPSSQVRELAPDRRRAGGAGADDADRRAPAAADGFDVAADATARRRIGDGAGGRRAVRAARRARDRHRRRAAGHRGVHPRPAAPGRLRAGRPRPVGRDRLGARRVPRRRGDRRRAAALRADAVPDLVAGLARRRRGGRAAARLLRRSSSRSRRWSTATSARTARRARPGPRASRRARCGAATSWPGCG